MMFAVSHRQHTAGNVVVAGVVAVAVAPFSVAARNGQKRTRNCSCQVGYFLTKSRKSKLAIQRQMDRQ